MYYEICTHTIGAQFPTDPLLSGHLERSRRCPLNRGFTVYIFFVGVLLTNPSPTSIQGTLALVPRESPE